MKDFDVVIIGAGPGGYVCAVRCAQLGLKTALVEKYSTLGGTCLNVGCIPSKAWLDSSERYFEMTHSAADHGIESKSVSLNFKKMRDRVATVVDQTCQGIDFLMKKNKIEVFHGVASFKNKNEIVLSTPKGEETLKTRNTVIATGSKPATLPGIEFDKKRIISSTEALKLDELPKSMVVIGGGAIGLEMGSVFQRLGTEVTVVEYAPTIIPNMDADLSKELLRSLKKLGMKFLLNHKVQSVKASKKNVLLNATDQKKTEEVEVEAELCLVSVGRKPFTDGLGLDKVGIELDERGRIPSNEKGQTTVPEIFAIGDVTQGLMLAHKAEEEGVYVAEVIAGQKPVINHALIPNVVYTWPEVSAVGATEAELKEQGRAFKKGSFPFKASGRARASNEGDGLIKVLADEKTDEILGVHMVGPRAADMIAEAVLAMEYKASAEDVARVCHAHPTYTEALKEACLAATENRAVHI